MPPLRAVMAKEDDPRVADLRRRLDHFYATISSYDDFTIAVNRKDEFWRPVRGAAESVLSRNGACRILEFGAGRTGFAEFLGDRSARNIVFDVQDVTPQNRAHLESVADHVHIGDVADLPGAYDIIFSTFVWEHVTNPRETYAHLLSILAPGGSLFIACPRYDAPMYIPPSARHYSLVGRIGVGVWLMCQRLTSRGGGDFWIHTDPAVLSAPLFHDADAIHWVSLRDFGAALPPGYALSRVRVPFSGFKSRLWERFLLAYVRIDRAFDRP